MTIELVTITFPTSTIRAVVARSSRELARGLMGVRRLRPRTGLLLAFGSKGFHPLWMRNVPIPLDMIFLDERKIVGIIHSAPPMNDTSLSIVPSLYVLEVAGGTAIADDIDTGQPWTMR